jgi:hypothetical protein
MNINDKKKKHCQESRIILVLKNTKIIKLFQKNKIKKALRSQKHRNNLFKCQGYSLTAY